MQRALCHLTDTCRNEMPHKLQVRATGWNDDEADVAAMNITNTENNVGDKLRKTLL